MIYRYIHIYTCTYIHIGRAALPVGGVGARGRREPEGGLHGREPHIEEHHPRRQVVVACDHQPGFRVQGSGFRVQGLGFRLRVQGSGFRVEDSGVRVQGSG